MPIVAIIFLILYMACIDQNIWVQAYYTADSFIIYMNCQF